MHFSQKLGISFSLSQETMRCRQQKSGDKSLETTIESIHFKFQDAATDNDLENPKILEIGVFSKKRFLGQNMELFAGYVPQFSGAGLEKSGFFGIKYL